MPTVTDILDALSADPDRTPEDLLEAARVAASRRQGDASAELERPTAEAVYIAQEGDMLDLVAHRRYGTVTAVTRIRAANPDLTGAGPRLPAGTRVVLPEIEATPQDTTQAVQLWD